ncbi:AMP-binding enzyme [Pseudofrankia asymbiotica]|uniref:AMP-binding enzyme C-terminal domain-containing protein n=1 Tax=Pseudofrankia asymbiotica TaxID=1834516 RepID=A0A1V2IH60_9ACTN|nr:hypothetical protein [Pseudofrankia asymbiotica]ONH32457.1 hypothetical protein BL253_05370 [Pseudofrankia asymbiotica]
MYPGSHAATDPEKAAVVMGTSGERVSYRVLDELRAYLRDSIAGYKVPRVVAFRDELPRMPTGKLAKGRLREEYLTDSPA